jgi:hypothetical protein
MYRTVKTTDKSGAGNYFFIIISLNNYCTMFVFYEIFDLSLTETKSMIFSIEIMILFVDEIL